MTLLLVLLGCGAPAPSPVPPPPGLESVTIDPLLVEIGAAHGRPRIYNFWATWCGPCMRELPALRAFGRAHPEVDLILVNVDHPDLLEKRVRPTLDRMKLLGFRNLALDDPDPARALTRLQGWPNSIPVTLVVDGAGTRLKQFNTQVDERQLVAALAGAR